MDELACNHSAQDEIDGIALKGRKEDMEMRNGLAVWSAGLQHCYGQKRVLEDVSLQVEQGEIFGLLGPSGAGKTTLIKILTGQLKQESGTAQVFGRPSGKLTGQDHREIGIMMDSFGLYERMNCIDNLRFFTMLSGIPRERGKDALEKVGLWSARKTLASRLSKGMRNRLLLARAFLGEPRLLFLDEPTSGLDPRTAAEIHELLLKEKERGAAIFLTTHNMVEAQKLCDHVALLNEGRVVECGKPNEICRKYNHQKKLLIHLFNGEDLVIDHDKSGLMEMTQYLERGEIETIHSSEPDLETVFMELTGRGLV